MRGLVEGSRDAFLKSENNGEGGSDWDSHKIGHGTYQLQASQVAGGSGTHSGAPKYRTSIARITLATPAQLRVVDKLLDPREMELPDAACEGTRLTDDRRLREHPIGQELGSLRQSRSSCCEGDHRSGIGLRGNVSQVVLAGDFDILTARS